ncbi:MAG: magnesium transporter CorA family protein [Candidatus Hydrogenedentota bacterium]
MPAVFSNFAAFEAAWEPEAVCWVDVATLDRPVIEGLARLFGLEHEAVEDSLEGTQRARTDDYEDHLFVLLYAAVGREEPPFFSARKLCMFYAEHFLITLSDAPVRTIEDMHIRLSRFPQQLGRGLDQLFFDVVDGVVDNYVLCAETYDEKLEALETESLSDPWRPGFLADVTAMRRELIEFRRALMSLRELLTPYMRGAYRHITEGLARDFLHVHHHLTYAWELAEGLREITQGIRENFNAQLAERQNNHMRTLTIFATFLLPLSLIAGIYGMNVPLWPGENAAWAFPAILGVMGVVATGMILFFRKRHWF